MHYHLEECVPTPVYIYLFLNDICLMGLSALVEEGSQPNGPIRLTHHC
uniref:Uncharacterized protein n=1 Tax=Rhizophora mucronata TaxID=61149 RepID=A0A2P2NSS8_RHIMU